MEKIILNVDGMSCEHCVNAIENALNELDGVEEIEVSLDDGTVAFEYDKNITNIEDIKLVIDEEGYEVL